MSDARCPALSDLFAAPQAREVAEHVGGCPRCQALLASVEERVQPEGQTGERARTLKAAEPEPGTVVLVAAPDSDEHLVAVVAKIGEDAVTVVPLSEQVELATDWALLLEKDPLGYATMAEIWNYGSVLPEQLVESLATLDAAVVARVETMLRAAISSAEVPHGLPLGVRVLDDADPRLLFQEDETERVHAFWEPTLALAGAATLGQLVRERREELALDPEELEEAAGQRGWLGDIERDELDIPSVLSPKTLAAFMRRLHVGGSRRLGRLTLWTIEAQRKQASPALGVSFGRKRKGYRGGGEQEQSATEYVDEFLRELEE
jgi:hypothetical protein